MTFDSNRERKSAAVFTKPATCAILKLNCSTYSHAFHKDGGMALACKNRVTDLLSVKKIVGFVASHKMCENLRIAM